MKTVWDEFKALFPWIIIGTMFVLTLQLQQRLVDLQVARVTERLEANTAEVANLRTVLMEQGYTVPPFPSPPSNPQ